MRAAILGGDANALCQIPSLREGFNSLGHEHTFLADDTDTAFVFVGNPPFEDYLELAKHKKTIFNVLDLCPHCSEHLDIVERLKVQLPQAARVTAISQTVANELKAKCGVNADVIYYPSKKIFPTGVKRYKGIRALIVGRVNDPNKRTHLAIQGLIRAGFEEDEVAVVGPENPRYGRYYGTVSDEVLNDLYNSTDYVMMTSLNEGIGLPACEGAMAGAIPIVLPDLVTFNEFWVESPLGLHYQLLNSSDRIGALIRNIEDTPGWKDMIKQDMLAYATQFLKPKFDRVEVAKRIISTFQSI